MAFNVAGLELISSSASTRVFSYESADALGTILAPGYFDAVRNQLRRNDLIRIESGSSTSGTVDAYVTATAAPVTVARAAVPARVQQLKRLAALALARNPLIAGTASGVTVTAPATDDATLTNKVYAATSGGVTATPERFAFHGGTPVEGNNGGSTVGTLFFPVANLAPATSAVFSTIVTTMPTSVPWTWEVEFWTDAPVFEVIFRGNTVNNLRLLVDGQYATAAAVAPNAYTASMQRLRVDFTGVRKARRIQFRGRQNFGFRGVHMDALSSVWAPDAADVLKVAVTGDSYGEGQGLASPSDPDAAFALQMGHLLGWADIRQVAVGSTGYLADASGTRSIVRSQIANWQFTPDVIVCAAGVNDTASNAGAVATEALRAWQAMRAAAPDAAIFVAGPWPAARGPNAATITLETSLKAAFDAWGDGMAFWVPVTNDSQPYLFGTGNTGATNGSGNSDVYISSDGLHPSDAGHAHLGRRLATGIRAIIGAM